MRLNIEFTGFSKSKQRELQFGTSFEKLRVTIGLSKIVYLKEEQCNDLGKGDLSYNSISSLRCFFVLKTLGLTSSILIAIDFSTSLSYEESYRSCFLLLAKYYAIGPSFEDSEEAWL